MMLECFVLYVPEPNECILLAIAWQRFFALVAQHAYHKLSNTWAVGKKSGQSLRPFLAKADDD